MIEIRRILCPIDFSDYSRRALDHAVAIARWYDSTVTVLHVVSTTPAAAYAPGAPGASTIVLTPTDRDQLLGEMRRFVGEESAPGIRTEMALRDGPVVAEILSQAAAMKADLLVVGTHGRSGFERLLLGSVAEKVLRKATCPVLSVPPRQPDAVPATPVIFKQILCPVDFSPSSMQALSYATSLAQEADAHLTVLHVMAYDLERLPDLPETGITDEHLSLAEFRRRREETARRRLKAAVPDSVTDYCSVETMIADGKAAREILRVAADQQADVIVIGVHGRSAADLAFFGSTTQSVVRQATCPVLTLRED